jgi:hypothetical protein
MLFALARELAQERAGAALVVLAWAVNPLGIEASQLARPYELFGVTSTAFLWLCVRYARPTSSQATWRAPASLGAAAFFGLLTHYEFLFVVAAGGAYLAWVRGFRGAAVPVAGIAAGLVLTNIVHPTFTSILVHPSDAGGSRWRGFEAILREAFGFYSFLYDDSPTGSALHAGVGLGMVIALLAGIVILARGRDTTGEPAPDFRFLAVPLLLIAASATTVLIGAVPAHTYRPRHLNFLWPLLAVPFGFPWTLTRLSPRRALAASLGVGILLASVALCSVPSRSTASRRRGPTDFADCPRLVIPGTRRLDVLAGVMGLPAGLPVFVGNASDLDRVLGSAKVKETCLATTDDTPDARRVLQRHGVTLVGRGRLREGADRDPVVDDEEQPPPRKGRGPKRR